jgi:four helix bundle protein
MSTSHFRELDVWNLAMDLVVDVYRITKNFPTEEKYGLTSQIRRAAVSVPSNIAEGQGRRTAGEFLNQLSVARGSLMELRTQLEIALRLDFMSELQFEPLQASANRVGKLMNGLMNSLESKR